MLGFILVSQITPCKLYATKFEANPSRIDQTTENITLLPIAVFTHGPQGPGPGPRAANFQGRHIKKKSRLKYGMRKKRLSTREKFKGDLY